MESQTSSQESANETVAKLVNQRNLPSSNDFLGNFHDENGDFYAQESDMFDYKEVYPFSNSDGIFAGILRLICALHNTYGGIIIFGVHDAKRTAGKNTVIVDEEKINRKLRESLTQNVTILCRTYTTPSGNVDVMLVPKRAMPSPVRFKKAIAGKQPSSVFFRRGAEVLEAGGSELDFLYGPRTSPYDGEDQKDLRIDSALPASPATIGRLLGRYEVIETVFEWLQTSRDARFFLWGDGGSGKSTMAYEVARLLSLIGKGVQNKYANNYNG